MKSYKKMFDLEWNGKKFTIFLAENNRCAFLEINEQGEYRYPLYEDFLVLNNAYNNRNPYIKYEIPRFTFDEKVKHSILGVLAIAIVWRSGYQSGMQSIRYEASPTDTELVLTAAPNESEREEKEDSSTAEETPQTIYINNTDDIGDMFGSDNLTIEEVHKTIDANPNLPDEYKVYSHLLADVLAINCPEGDLKIFNENAKDKKVNTPTPEALKEKFRQSNVGANYCSGINQMNIPPDTPTRSKIHEDAHTVTNFNQVRNGNKIIKCCYDGTSLDEAMNNKIVNLITETTSYKKGEAVLDFYCSCVPFTLEDYLNRGIPDLISKLEMQYPDLDINYLIKTLDKIKDTDIEFKIDIPLDSSIYFLNELFEMCKRNACLGMVNPYEPFTPFAKILRFAQNSDLFYSYLEQYNEHLESLEYPIVSIDEVKEKWQELQYFSGFARDENGIYPCKITAIQDAKGNSDSKIEIITTGQDIKDFVGSYAAKKTDAQYLLYSLPENYEIIGTEEYWNKMATESGMINQEEINPVDFYFNREIIGQAMIKDMVIQVGLTNDNEIGFILRNRKGNNIVYISSPNLSNISNAISFSYYLPEISDFNKLELSTYLSPLYLRYFLNNNPRVFQNVILKDGEILVEPYYKINIIKDNNEVINLDVSGTILDRNEKGMFYLSPTSIGIDFDGELEIYPTLKEILAHYNYFNPDKIEYTISIEELMNMITGYLNEFNVNKAR